MHNIEIVVHTSDLDIIIEVTVTRSQLFVFYKFEIFKAGTDTIVLY